MTDEDREKKRRETVRRAEVALRELELDANTQAFRTRIDRVRRGLRLLDDEQAEAKDERDAAVAEAGDYQLFANEQSNRAEALRRALLVLAPCVAVLAREKWVAPEIRSELLRAEPLMLAALEEPKP